MVVGALANLDFYGSSMWNLHFADRLPVSAAWLVWDKRDGMTSNNNSDVELAWASCGGSARLIRHLWNGMLKASEREDRRAHPTQKPVAVMRWCIEQLPSDCKTIFDPFMGSGTTGVAAVKMGRNFTGIEIDPTYFDVSCRRIAEAVKQPDMFVTAPKTEQLGWNEMWSKPFDKPELVWGDEKPQSDTGGQ